MYINKAHGSTMEPSGGSPWRDLITLIIAQATAHLACA